MQQGSAGKTFIFVILAVVIIIVLWFVTKSPMETNNPNGMQSGQDTMMTGGDVNEQVNQIKESGNSDEDFTSDTSAIDSQLNQLNSETSDALK